MAQFPAGDCLRDIQDGRVYQKFIQHDPCTRGKKVLSIIVSSELLIKSKKFSISGHLFVFLWSCVPKKDTNLKTSYLLDCGLGSPNHMCHYFLNILPVNYSIWQMVVILTMKHVNLCHQCAKSNLLYHTCLPKPCF